MDTLDFAVDLSSDVSVRSVPLFGRAQLDEVKQLAEIPSDQDA